ncbi:uncharacterized protein BDR25DRAFT_340776 [Lindgomyces ingoldianus]|uniref:Uncharacterized protein n=1 Tax=Lindgomyces ingoldianus TaxID=673940 RepID=A0ACB6R4M3_9PLEO|nr:uncharacterized protein BDR25DRAFT_340776 [Lindgomyces ingoldianus]KAF2474223.1 hypothetical protein BDR25DRAFT_340776 [Lindgomyces ingoldianus]
MNAEFPANIFNKDIDFLIIVAFCAEVGSESSFTPAVSLEEDWWREEESGMDVGSAPTPAPKPVALLNGSTDEETAATSLRPVLELPANPPQPHPQIRHQESH